MPVLSLRALNRTLLERQLLASRAERGPLDVIEHLVAVQGQEPNAPYVGLWTRLADFRHEELTSLLYDRRVVRSKLLRNTQHLVSSHDFRWLQPLLEPVLKRSRQGAFGRAIAGIDLTELADAGSKLLAGQTLTRPQLGRLLAERFPGRDATALAYAAQSLVAHVHPPPSGTWGHRGATPLTLAEAWTGLPPVAAPPVETMVCRYLAAFGPASVRDIQTWSGLTRLREVTDGMRSRLRTFRDERGAELLDLPDAPLTDPDLPVPVRFLPDFDNLVLGHADRTRVLGDEDRKRVAPGGAMVLPTFLVDGFVHGTWSMRGSTLLISPFRPLSTAEAAAVADEAGRLHSFAAADAAERDIVFG